MDCSFSINEKSIIIKFHKYTKPYTNAQLMEWYNLNCQPDFSLKFLKWLWTLAMSTWMQVLRIPEDRKLIEQDTSFQTWKTHSWKTTPTWTNVAFSYRKFSNKREMHIEPLLLKYISMWGEKITTAKHRSSLEPSSEKHKNIKEMTYASTKMPQRLKATQGKMHVDIKKCQVLPQ